MHEGVQKHHLFRLFNYLPIFYDMSKYNVLISILFHLLLGHTEITTGAISDNALEPTDVAISTSSPVRSQNNQITNQLLQVKIDEAKSQTNIMLI